MCMLGDGQNLGNLAGIGFLTTQTSSLIINSWEETYYSHPTRLSILDPWIGDNEEISQVICGSRFTVLLTSFHRLLIL
jgi:hypothetical protein